MPRPLAPWRTPSNLGRTVTLTGRRPEPPTRLRVGPTIGNARTTAPPARRIPTGDTSTHADQAPGVLTRAIHHASIPHRAEMSGTAAPSTTPVHATHTTVAGFEHLIDDCIMQDND
jgi:hypothetical protein